MQRREHLQSCLSRARSALRCESSIAYRPPSFDHILALLHVMYKPVVCAETKGPRRRNAVNGKNRERCWGSGEELSASRGEGGGEGGEGSSLGRGELRSGGWRGGLLQEVKRNVSEWRREWSNLEAYFGELQEHEGRVSFGRRAGTDKGRGGRRTRGEMGLLVSANNLWRRRARRQQE